ncbi:MAG: hypothetical protein KDA28_06375 [Phycisphaerales bacterium]|nr:hypothetical protein [Phycisphaerales bacterium]
MPIVVSDPEPDMLLVVESGSIVVIDVVESPPVDPVSVSPVVVTLGTSSAHAEAMRNIAPTPSRAHAENR